MFCGCKTLLCYSEGMEKTEYVLEPDAEEDVWSWGRGSNMGIEKI